MDFYFIKSGQASRTCASWSSGMYLKLGMNDRADWLNWSQHLQANLQKNAVQQGLSKLSCLVPTDMYLQGAQSDDLQYIGILNLKCQCKLQKSESHHFKAAFLAPHKRKLPFSRTFKISCTPKHGVHDILKKVFKSLVLKSANLELNLQYLLSAVLTLYFEQRHPGQVSILRLYSQHPASALDFLEGLVQWACFALHLSVFASAWLGADRCLGCHNVEGNHSHMESPWSAQSIRLSITWWMEPISMVGKSSSQSSGIDLAGIKLNWGI